MLKVLHAGRGQHFFRGYSVPTGTTGPKVEALRWPKTMLEQIAAVREALMELGEAGAEEAARRFKRARTTSVVPLLDSLAALGQAEVNEDDSYAA